MDFFFKDAKDDIIVTWDALINDLNKVTSFNPYCKSVNYFEVFNQVITSMLIGQEIILLDSDFSDDELVNLTGYSQYDKFTQPIQVCFKINDKMELIEKLRNTSNDWKVTLFTSGTTGLPKKVTHNFTSITRFVKYAERNTKSTWGFAYNPTHMAGIQVFLQALLNGNPIVRLFGMSPKEIHREIKEDGISHISATPTFYKLLLPCEDTFTSVERITSGGERFNERIQKLLTVIFPKAKITNVYASTEAGTIFASDNDIFSIKSEFEHLIKVENNELLIQKSLMGNTDINIKEWYNTGDLIEIISNEPLKFRFISRKSDMINVGGYKVNPIELEEIMLTLSGIKDVRVYSKTNSVLGNIICCEVVRNSNHLEELSIRAYLQSKIQEFKIPRVIKFVDELSTTRTGKIKRN